MGSVEKAGPEVWCLHLLHFHKYCSRNNKRKVRVMNSNKQIVAIIIARLIVVLIIMVIERQKLSSRIGVGVSVLVPKPSVQESRAVAQEWKP